MPDNEKPKLLVRRFTQGSIVLWLMGGLCHITNVLFGHTAEYDATPPLGFSRPPRNWELLVLARAPESDRAIEFSTVPVVWPHPANLFVPTDLFCNQTVAFATNRFALWAASRSPAGIADFVRVGTSVSAVHCGAGGCSFASQSPWAQDHSLGSAVQVPSSWRLATVVPACPRCEDVWVAGWDGTEVHVASAHHHGSTWSLDVRFPVRPGLGGATSSTWSPAEISRGYDNLRGLQLGADGMTLLVLVGSSADGWSLSTGAFLGRWSLLTVGQPVAMCHDDERVLLVTKNMGTYALEEATLPNALRQF